MRRALLRVLVACAVASLPARARADEASITEAQRAQLETLRGEIAAQLQLQAYDLLDELVYGWSQQPPFALDTPVVLADVSVPVGFGSGLQALVENHFAGLVTKNPRTRVVLSHCPQCTAVVVHSVAKGTVVSRGADEPEALAAAGALSGSRHALFLDFEVEGVSLVLRARITSLTPALPIVYAKTLSTSVASPALLRSEDHLKSAAEARREYLDALEGRGLYTVPVRVGVRSYARGSASVVQAPYPWLQAGVETSLTQARAWVASFSLGVTWAPSTHTGWLAQARIGRLLFGDVASLTRPSLYLFFGGSVISIYGNGAAAFADGVPNLEALLAAAQGNEPHAIFPAFQFGLEARVKNRIAVGVFGESLPTLSGARAIGSYLDLGFVTFKSVGAEVSFCF